MPNNAITAVTVWSERPTSLAEVRQRVSAPPAAGTPGRRGLLSRLTRHRPPPDPHPHPFSLESISPSGMSDGAWDAARAEALWGCSRPETSSDLVQQAPGRLVYEVVTAYAPPDAALRTLSEDHPDVVVHAVTTCESEYAWTAWFVRGQALRVREVGLDLTDEEWEDWDGEWDLPADWSFDVATARALATGDAV